MPWLLFTGCAALIAIGGTVLARAGDAMAERTGLSRSWIGVALLATITSLPELVTGLSAVTLAEAPNVAVGDALGSCVINLVFLVVIDASSRHAPLYTRTARGHVVSAGFGVVLLAMVTVSILVAHLAKADGLAPLVHAVGAHAFVPLALLTYVVALRAVFQQEHTEDGGGRRAVRRDPAGGLAWRFGLAATAVVAGGIWLPALAVSVADSTGWSRSFVGSLFVALTTSLPELVLTVAALRIAAIDLAIGNLLGSNLFNVAIVALDDLADGPGALLGRSAAIHAVTASSAVLMTGLVLVGLACRPADRWLRAVGSISLALLAVYVLNTYVLLLHAD